MLDAILSTRFIGDNDVGGFNPALSDGFFIAYADALDAFIAAADPDFGQPDMQTTSRLTYGDSVNNFTIDGLTLSGNETPADIIVALDSAVASGSFGSITVVSDGQTILSIAPNGLSSSFAGLIVATGDIEFFTYGGGPDTIAGIGTFIEQFNPILFNPDIAEGPHFAALTSLMTNMGIQEIRINQTDIEYVSVAEAGSKYVVTALGLLIVVGEDDSVDPLIPLTELGLIVDDVILFLNDENGGDGPSGLFTDHSDLMLNVVAYDGTQLFSLTGDPAVDGAAGFNSLVFEGTEFDDRGLYIAGLTTDVVTGVTVNGNAGDDEFGLSDAGADLAPMTINGGTGYDTLHVGFPDDATSDIVDPTLNFDFGTGTVDLLDNTDAQVWDVSTTSIEELELEISGAVNVTGDANDNTVSFISGPNSFYFDGGNGQDTVQMDRIVHDLNGGQFTGMTRAQFEDNYQVITTALDTYEIRFGPDAVLLGTLANVEAIQFKDGEGTETVLVQALVAEDAPQIIDGTEFDDELTGSAGNETLSGFAGDDIIFGLGGDDVIYGGADYDELFGGAGNDLIITGTGDDYVSAGSGNDVINATEGGYTVVNPGTGVDVIIGATPNGDSGVILELDDLGGTGGIRVAMTGVGIGTATSNDGTVNTSFTGVDVVFGSIGNDVLSGSSNANFEGWVGFAGNDVINGGAGFDELMYNQEERIAQYHDDLTPSGVTVNLATGIATDVFGGTDTVSGIEAVRGTSFDDTIIGANGARYQRFRGLEGDDVITGGVGGFDVADYSKDEEAGGLSGITANLITGQITDGFGNTDTVSRVEMVSGTQFADQMTANDSGMVLDGRGGDDVLVGGTGGDVITGGTGSNQITGGGGVDVADFGDVTLANASIILSGTGGNTVVTVSGTSGNDSFDDTITQVEYFEFADVTRSLVQLSTAEFSNNGFTVDRSASTSNEALDGGDGNDIFTVGSGNDDVRTGFGDDIVTTGAGDDYVFNTSGNDTINGGDGADTGVALSGNNTFNDTGSGDEASRDIDDFYCGGIGDDVFNAGSGHDVLIGDVGTNYFAGKDRMNGGTGDDIMQGGGNADTFIFADNHGNDTIARVDLADFFANDVQVINDVAFIDSQVDFEIGVDLIDLRLLSTVFSFADLLITDGVHGAVIDTDGTVPGQNTITLRGISAADLTDTSFLFDVI